jgi:hypothetical protein
MKATALGVVLAVALSVWAVAGLGHSGEVLAEGGPAANRGELVAVSATIGDKAQQVAVIDPRQRVMSVYQIEFATGAVTLKSVRNITWDLQLSQFNGVSPLPNEIRALLDQK